MPTHTSFTPARHHVAVAALVAAAACWGVGTVVTKQVVDDVRPLTLLPLQLAASTAFLLAVAAVRREPLEWTASLRRLAGLGVLNPGLAYALGLVGLTTITASLSVLLWAAEPVLILLLAVLMLGERISVSLGLFLGLALAGVILVVYQPGAAGDPAGVALTLAGVGCCAVYTVLARRLLLDDASLKVALAQQAVALVFAVLLAIGAGAVGATGWALGQMDAEAWLGAMVSGVLYYGLAFWLYLTGLRHVPASYAGAFLPLIPVYGVAAGYLVGERLDPRQWFGAALVIMATTLMGLRELRGGEPAKRPAVDASPPS
jgi:probable blue pigment (indigoidine) exporter